MGWGDSNGEGVGWWIREDIAGSVHVLWHLCSKRRMWVKVDTADGEGIFIMGIYNWAARPSKNEELLLEVAREAGSLGVGRVVWVGDFNARVGCRLGPLGESKVNTEGKELVEVVGELTLSAPLLNMAVLSKDGQTRDYQWTRIGRTAKQTLTRTTIDYIFVGAEIVVEAAEVLDNPIGSDHRPILCVLGDCPIRKRTVYVPTETWCFASSKREEYELALAKELEKIDLGGTSESIWSELKEAIFTSSEEVFSKVTSHSNFRGNNWWNRDCSTARKEMQVAWETWKGSGSALNLALYREKKKLYRFVIRKSKSDKWNKTVEKVVQLGKCGDSKGYWRGVRSFLSKPHKVPLWWSDGEEWSDDPIPTANKWAAYWVDLCGNVEADESMKRVVAEDLATWRSSPAAPVLITVKEVSRAREFMSLKAGGYDGIRSHMVKWGGDAIDVVLAALFTACMEEGSILYEWWISVIVPLTKGILVKGPQDTRGISLNSIVEKIFERILLWRSVAKDLKPLRDEQGGFREGQSAAHWIWAVREEMRSRPKWVVLLVDLVKAFDKVWRDAMLWKMRKMGLVSAENVLGTVCLEGWYSDMVELCNGLKQGGVVSPWAFIMFLDDLAEDLGAAGFGSGDECRRAAFFLFVDDVGLITDDFPKAQIGLDVISSWSKKWGMGISRPKSVFLSNIKRGSLVLDGSELRRVPSERYLGFYLSVKKTNVAHERFLLALVKGKIHMITRTRLLVPLMGIRDGLQLWRALIHSVVYWAVGAWHPTVSFMDKLDKMKRKFVRRLLGVSACTCNSAVEGEVALLRATDDACYARLLFWDSLKRSTNKVVIELREREDTEL